MSAALTNSLDSIVTLWRDWMWSMSLHVTWLVVILWLLDRPLRRTSARLRFVLWSLVLLRLVIPPNFTLPTGISWWVGGLVAEHTSHWTLLQPNPKSTLAATVEVTSATSIGSVSAISWSSFLFTLWLGFVAAQLIWLALGWRQVRRWLAQSTPLTDAQSEQILQSAKLRAGFDGLVTLHDSGSCVTPLVVGFWRPKILLPTIVRENLSAAELETVIVHELTHLSRGDIWWRASQAVLGIAYFFHPAVWLARRRLNQVCEEACDEQTVLALAGRRRDYAQAIVKAATVVGYQPPYIAMNMLGDALPVKRRLERILDPALTWQAEGRWRRGLMALALALLLLPSGYQSTQATPPQLMRQSGLPSVRQREDVVENVAAVSEADAALAAEEERQALEQLKSTELETRLAAYQTLERVGTLRSLPQLEAAFLQRRGLEQDAAKRALDRLWSIIRQSPSESSQTSRQFQSREES